MVSDISDHDADRILDRAAEIESEKGDQPLSADQLREIGAEAGFDPSSLDRAIDETMAESDSGFGAVTTSGFIGAKYTATRSIDVQLTAKELLDAVELIWPYFEGTPDVKFKKGRLLWRDRRKLRFEVYPGLERVELTVASPHLFGQKARWKTWVGKAADQIEAMILHTASRKPSEP